MSNFTWHLMTEETPEYGTNDYVVIGTRGALYVASKYSKYNQEGKGTYFYIPNRRDNFMDSKSVLAWAEIPPLEVECTTTEQAIEATLGRGRCEFCKDGKFDRQTVMISNHGWQRINFCPNCGRRIKVVGE